MLVQGRDLHLILFIYLFIYNIGTCHGIYVMAFKL